MKTPGLFFVAVGAALLAGLFFAFKPAAEQPVAVPPGVVPALPPPPVEQVFLLTVRKGTLAAGPDTLAVRQGDPVTIRIDADAEDELHLHGYDLQARLRPGAVAELRFTADRSGRFEYELHHAHAELGALEVQPR